MTINSLSTHLDTLQVNRVHNGALEKFHGRKMSLEKTLKFQVWWLSTNTIMSNHKKIESLLMKNSQKP